MKIIKVSNCIECPFSVMKEPYDLQSRLPDFVCRNAHKKIYDIDSLKIPEWCPLEDIKEVIAKNIKNIKEDFRCILFTK